MKKKICAIVCFTALAGCAQTVPPQRADSPPVQASLPQRAELLAGKWQCEASLPNALIRTDALFRRDGTAEGQSLITIALGEGAVWRFMQENQSRWRIDGGHYFEQQVAKPKVWMLPAESQSERILLRMLEKSNPALAGLKAEALRELGAFDEREISAEIVRLDAQNFVGKLTKDGMEVMQTCTRV
ncbi:hypothetical protein [Neisseria leonii]|uniref:hypothetical protein n=1 Tax=Neisseria leonii TaxID=2995413 RepID=UPI00237ABAB3|nr:hypothetical protein [Neisseria sp. 3986]MDD9326085.1 hypothetical protein [Neisseria sp. 3986]